MNKTFDEDDNKDSSKKPSFNFEVYELALENLPFGVSIQTKDRVIQYENEKAASLFGNNLLHDRCYHRWNYISGEGNSICKDCPATISFQDKKMHQVFRKTFNPQLEEIFLEIQCIPILNKDGEVAKYLEIIKDVTDQENAKVLVKYSKRDIIDSLEFSLIKYGITGSEIVATDNIRFITTDFETTLFKLASFTFIGLFQNKDIHPGLFGRLPVVDYLDFSMFIFAFNLPSKELTDPRKKGKDNCMMLMLYKREFNFLFSERDKITAFIISKFANISFLEEINSNWLERFKVDFKNYLTEIN